MYENNENTENQPEPQPVPKEMLEERIKELEAKVANDTRAIEELTRQRDNYQSAWDTLKANINKAERAFKEILAGDTEAPDIVDSYGQAMAEHLGWEFTQEVTIDINVSWRGTVELPFGTSVDDLDIDDFNLNEPEHSEYSSWFGHHGITDYSIEQRY